MPLLFSNVSAANLRKASAMDLINHAMWSFGAVFFSEFGDKSQLLTLMLAVRFRRKTPIALGMLAGVFLNHLIAAVAGAALSDFISGEIVPKAMGGLFILMGLWMLWALRPGKKDERSGADEQGAQRDNKLEKLEKRGAFLTAGVLFFLSEMGDKTQITAAMLGAQFGSVLPVVAGSAAAVVSANLLPLFFGPWIARRVSERALRFVGALVFLALGAGALI